MRRDFTRVDFGWWCLCLPGDEVTLKNVKPYRKVKSVGTQPDMWEFGTSRAAAWDCPAAIQIDSARAAGHPRIADLLEVMRRWEDVRSKDWLTPEMKEALKSATQEHHLYINERGEYELHEMSMLPTPEKASFLRGFVFERNGRRMVAYWHTSGSGKVRMALGEGGADVDVDAGGVKYIETPLGEGAVRAAFAAARAL